MVRYGKKIFSPSSLYIKDFTLFFFNRRTASAINESVRECHTCALGCETLGHVWNGHARSNFLLRLNITADLNQRKTAVAIYNIKKKHIKTKKNFSFINAWCRVYWTLQWGLKKKKNDEIRPNDERYVRRHAWHLTDEAEEFADAEYHFFCAVFPVVNRSYPYTCAFLASRYTDTRSCIQSVTLNDSAHRSSIRIRKFFTLLRLIVGILLCNSFWILKFCRGLTRAVRLAFFFPVETLISSTFYSHRTVHRIFSRGPS